MKNLFNRTSKRRLFYVITSVGIVLLFFLLLGQRNTSVAFITLDDNGYYPSLIATGEVVPPERIHLAAQVGGRVQTLNIPEGEIADSNEVVLTLDPRDYQIDYDRARDREEAARIRLEQAQTQTLREAEIALAEAKEEFKKAEREYNRQRSLYQDEAISRSAFEDTETAFKLAQNRLETARVQYESYQPGGVNIQLLESALRESRVDRAAAQLNLDYTQLRAPDRVRVLELNVERGELVREGEPVGILGTLDRTEIEVRIDQRFTRLGMVGTPAEVWISGDPGKKWSGRVVETKPRADAARGVRTSIVALDESPEELVPGTVVSVQLIAREPEAAHLLPDKFITTKDGQTGVWIEHNGRATFVNVTVGQRSENGVVVRGELSGGTHVLEPDGLSEGRRVTINEAKEIAYEI